MYLGSRSFGQPYKKLVKACSRAEGINKVTILKEKRKRTKLVAGYDNILTMHFLKGVVYAAENLLWDHRENKRT